MRWIRIAGVFALAALLLAACGGGGAQLEPMTVQIDMTEYAFDPANIELQVGQEATFELTNSGQLEHEIMLGREVMMENNRPAGYSVDLFETAGVAPQVAQEEEAMGSMEEEHAGFEVVLPPGGTASLTFPVTEEMVGQWEIGCFSQEGVHYDAGMKGTLVVNP